MQTEVEHLTRFVTAFLFCEAQTHVADADAALGEFAAQRAAAQAFTASAAPALAQMKAAAAAIDARRTAEKNGALKDLEGDVAKASKKLVQVWRGWLGAKTVCAHVLPRARCPLYTTVLQPLIHPPRGCAGERTA